jgi:hypothetical protein
MIAMRRPVTMKASDAAVDGRTADPGGTQSAHDGAVDGLAVVPGRFGGVDRELLPEEEAMVTIYRFIIMLSMAISMRIRTNVQAGGKPLPSGWPNLAALVQVPQDVAAAPDAG